MFAHTKPVSDMGSPCCHHMLCFNLLIGLSLLSQQVKILRE